MQGSEFNPQPHKKDTVGLPHNQVEWWLSGTGWGQEPFSGTVLVWQDENILEMEVAAAQ